MRQSNAFAEMLAGSAELDKYARAMSDQYLAAWATDLHNKRKGEVDEVAHLEVPVAEKKPGFWDVYLLYWGEGLEEETGAFVVYADSPEMAFAKAVAEAGVQVKAIIDHKIRRV